MYIEVTTVTDEGQDVVAHFEVFETKSGDVLANFDSAVAKNFIGGMPDTEVDEQWLRQAGVFEELEQDAIAKFDPETEREESESDTADLHAQGRREE